MNSIIANTRPPLKVKSKRELKRVVSSMLTKWKNIRILTDETDLRSQGHKVAIFEQDTNGKLTFLKGAPDLSMAANFFREAVEDGQIA
jgi:hypothetical protein